LWLLCLFLDADVTQAPHTKPIADLILVIKKPQLMRSIGVSGFLSFLMFWGGIEPPATWIRKSGIRDFLISLLPFTAAATY